MGYRIYLVGNIALILMQRHDSFDLKKKSYFVTKLYVIDNFCMFVCFIEYGSCKNNHEMHLE